MGVFARSLRVLLWRNFLYRKRRPFVSLIEFSLPIMTIGLLVLVKNMAMDSLFFTPTVMPAVFPTSDDTIIPLSFTDYVTALQAKRVCQRPGRSRQRITGITRDWSVPFVQCNTQLCPAGASDAVDASPYCEYRTLAIAPMNDDTAAFGDWILENNPALRDQDALPFNYSFIQYFNSSRDIDLYIISKEYGSSINYPKIGAAIILESGKPSYSYAIRVNSTNYNLPANQAQPTAQTTPPTTREFDTFAHTPDIPCSPKLGSPELGPWQKTCTGQYMYNGAITLQRLVDDWIIYDTGAEENGNKVAENGVSFVTFPTEEYSIDGFYAMIATFIPLLIVLGLMYPVSNMVRMIVTEKELRQKELMKMMSVPEIALELSWLISYFTFYTPSFVGVALVCDRLFEHSDLSLLIVFWLLVLGAIITFAMTTASLFSKASRSGVVGLMGFYTGYFASSRIDLASASSSTILNSSVHPVTAMSFGLQVIGNLENQGTGITWETLDFTDFTSGYSFKTTLQSLAISMSIWWCIHWYMNRVKSGTYGRALPFYFPCTCGYWFGRSKSVTSLQFDEEASTLKTGEDNSIRIEPVSDALKEQELDGKSVEIRNLTKTYGRKVAVDNFSLSMYSGQVTALLGHNGAGKTTTINMLTGMTKPTSGRAVVAGKDINTQMSEIREGVGICLQHDCLFPLLTVREHVQFFAAIKGIYTKKTRKEAEDSIETSIKDVALSEKSDTYSRNLSGGMKRKLSVAIAFCGDSEVVFLDEPTSGMDPFSRRFTWNVIRHYRPNRCIILTTHFMDEADLLGDRIAIMAEGSLRCVGSSLFLKKAYGVGYQLTIEKNMSVEPVVDLLKAENESDGSIENTLTTIIKEAVTEAKELSNVGTEMSFQLPLDSCGQFPEMFSKLDNFVDEKKIVTYGVSITTLDEVFLMVARGEDKKCDRKLSLPSSIQKTEESEIASIEQSLSSESYDLEESKLNRSKSRMFDGDVTNQSTSRHIRALFVKRAKNFKRDKKAWFCSVILPALLALGGFLQMKYGYADKNLPPLVLSIEDQNMEYRAENDRNPITFNTAETFTCSPGRCITQENKFGISQTEENYFMCGAAAAFGRDAVCSIYGTDDIMRSVSSDGIVLVEDETSTNIEMMSSQIHRNKQAFKASQYGALYFTRDAVSSIVSGSSFDGEFYDTAARNQCETFYGQYRTKEQCRNFEGISYVVSTNFTSIHGPLLYQAIADEALINEVVEEEVSISVKIHPLPVTLVEATFADAQNGFTAWFVIIFSFPFITGAFATFIVSERQSKAKHLQTVAGVKPEAYWISSYLWDIMNYQFPLWIIIILLYSFDINTYTTSDRNAGAGVIATLVLFGPASAAFTYCTTFLFESPSKANFVSICFNFLIGLAGPMIVWVLDLLSFVPDLKHLANIAYRLKNILRFIPCYNLGKALFYINNIQLLEFTTEKRIKTVWDPEVLLVEVVCLGVQASAYFVLAIFLDRWLTNPKVQKLWQNRCKRPRKPEDVDEDVTDVDVAAEERRIMTGEADSDLIVVKGMTKIYGRDKVAVDDLSFGVPGGQCFGLLGINGAGKTSTMAMLTAEFAPTGGDAILDGYSVTETPDETRRRIGYCPQFDAHFMNMTGLEHVELYAKIKGIPKEDVTAAAKSKLKEVGLSEKDSKRLSFRYSGGMKRKLSVACATIGQPPIIFLDEPSTGMDPVARRELWKVISKMVARVDSEGKSKTSIILTTHSMEECEALCPRIGIMANGKLKCIGSAQHLKSRFGKGYQVELKVALVSDTDDDYLINVKKLLLSSNIDVNNNGPNSLIRTAEATKINLETTKQAVMALTGDESISSLINPTDPVGYLVYKNATSSVGVQIDELAGFCTEEIRVQAVIEFMITSYPAVVRERQDNKVRFDVTSEDLKISSIFELIEGAKSRLQLTDYGISQTTLEQVFNIHAEEAETAKRKEHGRRVRRFCC